MLLVRLPSILLASRSPQYETLWQRWHSFSTRPVVWQWPQRSSSFGRGSLFFGIGESEAALARWHAAAEVWLTFAKPSVASVWPLPDRRVSLILSRPWGR